MYSCATAHIDHDMAETPIQRFAIPCNRSIPDHYRALAEYLVIGGMSTTQLCMLLIYKAQLENVEVTWTMSDIINLSRLIYVTSSLTLMDALI
jgi:hypothetical protein